MNNNIKKSLCICATILLLGGIVAPSLSNYSIYSIFAHRRHRITRIRKYHHTRKIHKARKNKISYRTYKYNLRKYNQYRHNLKKAERHLNYYKKLLRHKYSKRLMRKYTNSKHYWQKQINRLVKGSYKYQRVIKQYKHRNLIHIVIDHPHKNSHRFHREIKNDVVSAKVNKPKAHKLVTHHKRNHHTKRNLADSNHKYVLGTSDLVDNTNLDNIQHDEPYEYGGGNNGDLVHIIDQQIIDGKAFDYIKDPSGYDNDKWIYDGELSDNPNASDNNIDLNQLEKDITKNYTNSNASKFEQQMKDESLDFINNAREQNNLSPLNEIGWLDNVANDRAQQLTTHYGHYNDDGQQLASLDAYNFGYFPSYTVAHYHIGENIAINYIQPTSREPTDPNIYKTINGTGMAHAANNNMLNWDSHSNWGHRYNMLDSSYNSIGIGASFNPDTNAFTLAEDFSDTPYTYNESNENANTPGANNNYNNNNDNGNGNGTNGGGNGSPVNGNSNNSNNFINSNNTNINNYDYSNGNNNTILSRSNGAVIDHGSNNTINANGSVIVDGYNNTINSRGTVIANGYNNTVNAKKTIWNDTNTNDSNYQEALTSGVAINASNMNGQTISK